MMRNIILLATMLLLITMISCEKESPFTELDDLQDEFPEALFWYNFDYAGFDGSTLIRESNYSYPIAGDKYSFSRFEATSIVGNGNNLRFAACRLDQSPFQVFDSITGDQTSFGPSSQMRFKLNLAPEGDVVLGTLFSKEDLLDFLEVGKEFSTEANTLGSIEFWYNWIWEEPQPLDVFTQLHRAGEDENITENDYSITVTNVEEYEDLTRDGELIKKALKVTVKFSGRIGVNEPEGGQPISHLQVSQGTAVFLVDYQQ